MAGLKLDKLDVDAPRLDQPVHVAAQGSFDDAPATLAGTLGAPAAYLPGAKAPAPVPIDLALHALGSSLTVKGTAARGADGRPSVRAEVVADKIDLDAAAGRARQAARPGAGSARQAPPAPQAPPRVAG